VLFLGVSNHKQASSEIFSMDDLIADLHDAATHIRSRSCRPSHTTREGCMHGVRCVSSTAICILCRPWYSMRMSMSMARFDRFHLFASAHTCSSMMQVTSNRRGKLHSHVGSMDVWMGEEHYSISAG
jgi:hypothetical protein